ncbi:MAG: LysM peptidoglycan-binding domain-containing protein [Limnochordia bacterium]|jgi:N-acetylmuramoyl-L-alanine amidase|nr:LysM peptidoglycan-binding domain-containing protein [Limnochordia bacterium]
MERRWISFEQAVEGELNSRTTYEVYTVKPGDTLWGIAEAKLGVGSRHPEIKRLNSLEDDTLHLGQRLQVPKQ